MPDSGEGEKSLWLIIEERFCAPYNLKTPKVSLKTQLTPEVTKGMYNGIYGGISYFQKGYSSLMFGSSDFPRTGKNFIDSL